MGMTFLRKLDDGQVVRAKVIKKLDTFEAQNHQKLQFLLKLGEGSAEEVIDHIALCDKIEEMVADEEANPDRPLHTFKEILGHQGPLKPSDPNCKGSSYNVRLGWEDRSETDEPLGIVSKDDALTCADYARKHGLLDTPGWKFLRKHGRRTQKLKRMLKQARATAAKHAPIFKFGVQVPCHEHKARMLEMKLGHTRWTDAEITEQECLHDCGAFEDSGKGAEAPAGYKKIRVC